MIDNSIPTSNRMGWSAKEAHEINVAFAEFAGKCKLPVLDVGAGYGAASMEALRRGADLIVNDVAPEHLAYLCALTDELGFSFPRVKIGRFPGDLFFPPESLGAVHASNVFHFLSPEEFSDGIRKIYSWLVPGGKLFALTGTPYQGHLVNCGSVFDRRKSLQIRWPGWFENIREFNSGPLLDMLPQSMLLFDVETLSRELNSVGFAIEIIRLYTRSGIPNICRLDGRENLFVIAERRSI